MRHGAPRESDDEPRVRRERHVLIRDGWAGQRIFDVVRRAFPQVAARDVFRKSRCGELSCNRRPCQPLATVASGDLITVVLHEPAPAPQSTPLRQHCAVDTDVGPFWIVREDDDLLAVSKPAGCASHPAARHRGDTLLERVRHYLGVTPDSSFQPALANRLDIDTSGLVLIAKHRGAQRRLGRALQKGQVQKHYLALVGGWPDPAHGEICVPLLRHPDSRDLARFGRGHARCRGKVQEARTRYRTLQQLPQPLHCALLEIELLTGRTHQIRRHLNHVGHPLAGDRRYGDRHLNQDCRHIAALRHMFLHAQRVALPHPGSGEMLQLAAPLPAELEAALHSLGGSAPRESLDAAPLGG